MRHPEESDVLPMQRPDVQPGQVWEGCGHLIGGRTIRIEWVRDNRAGYTLLAKADNATRANKTSSVSTAGLHYQYRLLSQEEAEAANSRATEGWRPGMEIPKPAAGQRWRGKYGGNAGRVIRIDSATETHVCFSVVAGAPGKKIKRPRSRMSIYVLVHHYEPASAQ